VPDIVVPYNQIWIFLTDFLTCPKYKISQKSVWWDPCRQTDRHDKAKRHFLCLC